MTRDGVQAVDSLRGVYVLVVEDDEEQQTLLRTILRYCGAYVRVVRSAQEGLELLAHMLPDVLVIDLALADEDGFALIRQVRALKPEAGGMIRVVALGPRTGEEKARTLGVDGYLAKPLDPWALCHVIASLTAV